MEIDKLLDTHLYLYNLVSVERKRVGVECELCRRLLKPWLSYQCATEGDVKTAQTEAGRCQEQQKESQPVDKELCLINTVLAKAERTRSRLLQAVKNEDDEASLEPSKQKNTDIGIKQSSHHTDPSRVPNGMAKVKNRTIQSAQESGPVNKRPTKTIHPPTNQVGIISQSKINKLTALNKSSSSSKRPATVIPVHSRAPFQTEPDRARVKKPSRHSQASAGKPEHKREHSGYCVDALDEPTAGKAASNAAVTNKQEPCGPHVVNETKGDNPGAGGIQLTECNTVSENKQCCDSQSSKAYSQSSGTACVSKTEANQKPAEQVSKFCLIRDGSKLTIPTKVKKLFSRNCQLQKKLQTSKLTVKVDTANQKDKFLEKLDQMVEVDEKIQMGEAINKQITIHNNLLRELRELGLDQLSGDLSERDVLRKRMVLELILSTYKQAGHQVTQLTRGIADRDVCDQVVALPIQSQPRPDFPTCYPGEGGVVVSEGLTGAVSGGVDYRRKQDLMKYAQLQHSIYLLQVEKTIISEVLQFVLPELEQIAQESPYSAAALYRVVFALLSHPPGQLPTIVQDIEES